MSRCYGIIGTGAIGGYYGACLQQAGFPVHFLLRSDYEWVKAKGLRIESVNGDFTLPRVNAYNDPAQMPACDVVLVALKTTQNQTLPQILPSLVGEGSTVVLLQNGLGIEEEVAKIPSVGRVLGGLCFICSNKIGAGHIRHLDYGQVTLGEYAQNNEPCGITMVMQEIEQDFKRAGIETQLSEDLHLSRWQKLVWNISYNGLSVVLDATTEEIMANENSRVLVRQLMEEVAIGAKTRDRAITPDFIEKMLDYTTKMKPYKTSMKLDYDSHRPLEIEAIFGNPLKIAQAANTDLPRIRMLYQQLQFLEVMNCSQCNF
ncbi:putative 2-dehydropantoate 2-reductase [Lusitaniella coriacea LEGE 07157]|uniref:2-dehydropantoate 2-reductase n=1 Tax=Lusitaniella coriacea LEGE 07157 TaxID=945747 RepID=A0A8J7B813_9CYAN|nr:putative 2-dehydropantoate 2-reductase [Lusitaniella coriacea]MBE9114925.1 putative 2-dehydropantoate 2-reductase [Lusitaniella coriacea LEGE 07157]